jgi:hypothetical protein
MSHQFLAKALKGTSFEPIVTMFSNSKGSYQSTTAAFLPQYRDYFFEELRLEDYVQMGRVQLAQNTETKMKEPAEEPVSKTKAALWEEWNEVESGHYEYIAEDEPAPKPRVVLPVITRGIINISTVEQLQDKLEKTEVELRDLKMKMDVANAKEQKYLDLETELGELKEKVAADSASERKVLEERLEAQMKEKLKIRSEKMKAQAEKILKTRSDKMEAALNAKLAVLRAEGRTLVWGDLSDEQALEMLENHPMLSAKMGEAVDAARAEEIKNLELHFQGRAKGAKMEFSDIEIREMLKSNALLREIFKGNLSKQRSEITATLTAEFDSKLKSSQEAADLAKEQAVMESKKSALRISMIQKKILNVKAKLGYLENAAKTRSFATVSAIWEEIKNYTPSSINNDLAAMGQPAAALQQKPRTSLVGANHGSAIRGSAKSTPSIHSQEPENLVQPAAFHVVRRGPGQSPFNQPSSHSSSLHHPPRYLGPASNSINKHFANSDGSSNHSQVSSGKRGRDIADVGRKEGQKRPKV